MPDKGLQLNEWLARLETYSPHEIDLGLERVQVMLQRLKLATPATVIHVAGTNGKGSSVAMLDACLRTTDHCVGSYTSPHLRRFNERIRVDGVEASDDEIVAAFEVVEAQRDGMPLTYFEFGTLAALVVFAQRSVDVAILEVGLGGRLDAVNAVEPSVSLITSVALDHCEWLGDNVEAIAAEKAGVMRSGKPAVFAAADLPQAIKAKAEAIGAELFVSNRDYQWSVANGTWSWQFGGVALAGLERPSLPGDIQVQNAAGVLMVLAAAGFEQLLDVGLINSVLTRLELAGRAQTVAERFVVDVAHNPAAAAALADAIGEIGTGCAAVTILGMLNDKDVGGVVTELDELTEHWIAVGVDSPRAFAADELARQVANATDRPCWIAASMEQAISRAVEICKPRETILITGSFYTVEAALVILAAAGDEHG